MTTTIIERQYHHLTVSSEQLEALKEEAHRRDTTMAELVCEALNGRALRLPNPGGSLLRSLGIRVTAVELARYQRKAEERGVPLASWERSRLFTPGDLPMKTRRQMARATTEA